MLNLLNWNKPLKVNGIVFLDSQDAYEYFKDKDVEVTVELNYKQAKKVEVIEQETTNIYRIEVRQYMTRKSTFGFTFMKEFNNDVPMPYRTMYGEVLEENKGLVKMKLHARAEKDSTVCMKCGRQLTHEVSKFYGLGPDCGGHGHQAPDSVMKRIADKEEAFKEIDRHLRETVTWEGWIIKKAIQSKQLVETKKMEETLS